MSGTLLWPSPDPPPIPDPAFAGSSKDRPSDTPRGLLAPQWACCCGVTRTVRKPDAPLPNDPDYPRLWQIVNKNNQNRYIEYQKRTSRPIPIVVLIPKG